jgi:hypothetical protein
MIRFIGSPETRHRELDREVDPRREVKGAMDKEELDEANDRRMIDEGRWETLPNKKPRHGH